MSEEKQWPEERSWLGTCQRCRQPKRVHRVVPENGKTETWCLPCWSAHLEADPLPPDFPGRKSLIEAGHDSVQAVRELPDPTSVPGIGDATAAAITRHLEDA